MASSVLGSLRETLQTEGYAVLQTEPQTDALHALAIAVGRELGAHHSGVKDTFGTSEPSLLAHVECIFLPEDRLIGYLALGCLKPAESGGNTNLYDGRAAARSLLTNHPAITALEVAYRTHAYPTEEGRHPLVHDHATHGPVLRYRAQTPTNEFVSPLPDKYMEQDVYHLVDETLADSRSESHAWQPGEFVVINNKFMLHSRDPYVGLRQLLRFRFDDPYYSQLDIQGSNG